MEGPGLKVLTDLKASNYKLVLGFKNITYCI